MLVNVFASWCVPCRIEHPVLMRLAEQGVPIYGINYKDPPDQDARPGSPSSAIRSRTIGADRNGRVGIDWGVYGVPETYVVDKDGRIRLPPCRPDPGARSRADHPAAARGAGS